jgi:phosphatidylethanolamine-binding protein (PEBP) family uncharacterized protein
MRRVPGILAAALILTGCGGGTSTTTSNSGPASARSSIKVSSDFASGAAISRVHTCDGRDLSPPLRASGLPARTREIVVVMIDPDAPGGDFMHWGLAHLSSTNGRLELAAGARPAGAVPRAR